MIDVMYAIIKVYVNERNYFIKRHSNVIIIWRTSAVEVTALKSLRSDIKGVQEKKCQGWEG